MSRTVTKTRPRSETADGDTAKIAYHPAYKAPVAEPEPVLPGMVRAGLLCLDSYCRDPGQGGACRRGTSDRWPFPDGSCGRLSRLGGSPCHVTGQADPTRTEGPKEMAASDDVCRANAGQTVRRPSPASIRCRRTGRFDGEQWQRWPFKPDLPVVSPEPAVVAQRHNWDPWCHGASTSGSSSLPRARCSTFFRRPISSPPIRKSWKRRERRAG